jgi:hypothetical protein
MTIKISLAAALSFSALLVAAVPAARAQSQLSAPPDPSAITVARLHYPGGGDWYWGSSALPNLLGFLASETPLRIQPGPPPTVELTSPDLWNYPILFLTGHGNIRFSDQELQILRTYLTAGGFLIANDSYGLDAAFRREIARVFPDHPLQEVPYDNGLYRCLFNFAAGPPKIHEHDNKPAQGFGVFVDGRMVCYYVYQSDIGDGWEDPEVHGDPPDKRRRALEMGANAVLWSLIQ